MVFQGVIVANELVKWSGGKILKPSPVERCRQAREAALALLGQQQVETRAGQSGNALARLVPGLPVDLPRMCAVHGKPYAARYIFGKDGRFRLGSMIAVSEALYMRQYAGNGNAATVPGVELGDETCPLCGASGFGSVLCHVCKAEVCYGRTSANYFRCCPGCKGEGVMKPQARVQHGVTPVDMRWR